MGLARDTYYGLDAWRWWVSEAPSDLSRAKLPANEVAGAEPGVVRSFRELIKLTAFLNVMNKSDHLLYRGQGGDWPLLSTLLREEWVVPGTGQPVPLGAHRASYFQELGQVCQRVAPLLAGRLPRHRPFETFGSKPERRMAPWAVIQHYELWPTPVLDFSGSLRIAASFALGGAGTPRSSGYLFVCAFRHVKSDPMTLHTVGRADVALRLSAVCPPSAERPHLQDGFLVGNPRFSTPDLEAPQTPGVLVARIHLVDESSSEQGGDSFWDDDFPRHTEESLLPTGDQFLAMFVEAFEHQVIRDRAVLVDR
jgi:hypothetical protein